MIELSASKLRQSLTNRGLLPNHRTVSLCYVMFGQVGHDRAASRLLKFDCAMSRAEIPVHFFDTGWGFT